jgi:hypothetical protein
VFEATMKMLKADREMERDRERLVSVCCVPNTPVSIQRLEKVS